MKFYQGKIEFKDFVKWLFIKLKNDASSEGRAIRRAIIIEAALSQGISEEEAEKRVDARWLI